MIVIGLALVVCAYMAWNIGANDVANAMGTSVGSRALTLKQAIVIAAIFEFAGAFFAGDAVTETIRNGILVMPFENGVVTDSALSQEIAIGFIAAMMAAAVWLTIATRMGLPVSTTHSIIGGILGVGLILEVKHNTTLIDWEVVKTVVWSWVASPLIGGILAYFSYLIIKKTILESEDPVNRSRWLAPILAFPTFFVLGLALQFKALKGFIKRADRNGWLVKKEWLPYSGEDGVFNPYSDKAWLPLNALILAAIIGIIASVALYFVLRRVNIEEEVHGFKGTERIFVWLQIITAAYVAFAHGANDRSNAIGPMAAVWDVFSSTDLVLSEEAIIPLWLVLLGSLGITVGVMTWGWRVMETIGKKITDITPTRGFAAEFGAATTILVFSMPFLAVPVSTTHTLVGAVVGVGLAGGAKGVDFRVFGKIAASWIASVPVAAFGAIVLFVASGGNELNTIVLLPLSFMVVGYAIWKYSGEVHVEDALSDASRDSMQISPFQKFHEHAKAVEETAKYMLSAVHAACEGGDAAKEIQATCDAELRADVIKNELRKMLADDKRLGYQVGMNQFMQMVTSQDRIADYAQNVAEKLGFRPLLQDPQAQENLKKMAAAVAATVSTYEETVNALREFTISGETKAAKEKVAEYIRLVNLKEHEADIVEADAAKYVFSTGDKHALAAMHMYRVLQRLDDVANACETAANAFLPILNA